jgi:hypothetical protein
LLRRSSAIRKELEKGNSIEFDRSPLHQRVFALADRKSKSPLPRAMMPRIKLQSPKITRNLTTGWFAERVETRYRRCLGRAGGRSAGDDPR